MRVSIEDGYLRMVCKLDFQKAYDRVECHFLDFMMERVAFGVK